MFFSMLFAVESLPSVVREFGVSELVEIVKAGVASSTPWMGYSEEGVPPFNMLKHFCNLSVGECLGVFAMKQFETDEAWSQENSHAADEELLRLGVKDLGSYFYPQKEVFLRFHKGTIESFISFSRTPAHEKMAALAKKQGDDSLSLAFVFYQRKA